MGTLARILVMVNSSCEDELPQLILAKNKNTLHCEVKHYN